MMTKRAKWGVTAAILLMIAGMIAYPQLKKQVQGIPRCRFRRTHIGHEPAKPDT